LNLINGHISRLEQYRGNRMPKQMWIDAFGNSGSPRMLFDNALHTSDRIATLPVALKQIALTTPLQVSTQFLG
jgi:hypothetical protein